MPLRVFPVVGASRYSDDFGFVKPDGRTHQGIDIHAERGSPIVAVDDGVAKAGQDPRGGYVVNLLTSANERFYFAHLSSPGVSGNVSAGDKLGEVGDTGNAKGTSPHLHFEMHPNNGPAADPYKLLKSAQGIVVETKSPVSPWLIALGIVAAAATAAYVIRR